MDFGSWVFNFQILLAKNLLLKLGLQGNFLVHINLAPICSRRRLQKFSGIGFKYGFCRAGFFMSAAIFKARIFFFFFF